MKDTSTKAGKYLFLYLKTGGGHISTAKALERFFQKQDANHIEVIMADGLEKSYPIIKKFIVDGYAAAQAYGKWAYEFLYLLNKCYPMTKIHQNILALAIKSHIKDIILQEKPNKIVVFHFLLIKPVQQALKELGLDIPVVTIVTDPFTGTRTRFMEKNMKYIVYSERMKLYAMSLGIEEKNIKVFPPVINEKFEQVLSLDRQQEIKTSLHIPLQKKVILLLGSGDGFPKGRAILQQLCDMGVKDQVCIVCGRNQKLFRQAQEIKEKYPEFNLLIFGFIDFVYDLINISDIIFTKGGPATIFEILLCGKIPLIHTYMREQEKGNVEFVVDNKVGIYQKNIKKLTTIAKEMMDEDLSSYHRTIQNLNLKIGTADIAEYIKEL